MSDPNDKAPRVTNSPPEAPAPKAVEWYEGTVNDKPSRNNAPSVHLFSRQEVEPGKWYTDYGNRLGAGWGDLSINLVFGREELEQLLRDTQGDVIRIALTQNIYRGPNDKR